MRARVNISVADIRKESSQLSERINQVLFNELVDILEAGNTMSRIRSMDGYEGWLGNQFLTPHDKYAGDGPYIVCVSLSNAYAKSDRLSRRVAFMPYGCLLYGKLDDGWLELQSERYGSVHVSNADIIDSSRLKYSADADGENLIREVERFLGVPYLWGGRSFFGLDCSGLAGLIASRFGATLPRDTKDQIKAGMKISREEIRGGDLIFFPGHVAIAVDNKLYIHSSRSNGGVAYNSLDSNSPVYNAYHDESFVEARRIFN